MQFIVCPLLWHICICITFTERTFPQLFGGKPGRREKRRVLEALDNIALCTAPALAPSRALGYRTAVRIWPAVGAAYAQLRIAVAIDRGNKCKETQSYAT